MEDQNRAVEIGQELATLAQAWIEADAPSSDTWVKGGLMTPEEYGQWEAGRAIESVAYARSREAQEQVAYQPALPPEVQAIEEELKIIKEKIEVLDVARSGVRRVGPGGWSELNIRLSSTREAQDYLVVTILAITAPLSDRKMVLEKSLDAKTRRGTKAYAAREAAYALYSEARKEAGEAAADAYRQQHQAEITLGREAGTKRVRASRLLERGIEDQIRTLLNSVEVPKEVTA
jgi:hypothetical protein